jgi:hypothetical protein
VVAAGGLCFILGMRSTSPLSQASTLKSKAQSHLPPSSAKIKLVANWHHKVE